MKVIVVKIGYQEFVAPAAILDMITQLQPVENYWDNAASTYRLYYSKEQVSARVASMTEIAREKPTPITTPAEPTPE